MSVAAYVLESNRSAYDVPTLYAEFTGHALPACDDERSRMSAHAQGALVLHPLLSERLVRDEGLECYADIDLPLIPALARMEDVGLGVDGEVLADLAAELGTRIDAIRAEIFELAGTTFVIDSPKQLGEVLFEKLQLPSGRRTKTGFSTDAQVLGTLAPDYPIAAKVIEYRELTKLKSTYIDALPRLIREDGRLHTTFNQTVAATGRLSSSNPNLQNIPVRTDLGKRIRAAFVPAGRDDVIVSADYSQIELRILAHMSGDAGLIEAFTSGADFHMQTAARVFGLDPEHVDAEHRRRAKAVNFGIVYGISAHGLSESLRIDRNEAQEMIDRYFAAYPRVRAFLDETVVHAHETGYAVTMYGRRRYIPELLSNNHNLRSFGERTAMNHPMQGTAADIMKLAMIAVDRRLQAEGFESRLVLQVHDELVFEAPARRGRAALRDGARGDGRRREAVGADRDVDIVGRRLGEPSERASADVRVERRELTGVDWGSPLGGRQAAEGAHAPAGRSAWSASRPTTARSSSSTTSCGSSGRSASTTRSPPSCATAASRCSTCRTCSRRRCGCHPSRGSAVSSASCPRTPSGSRSSTSCEATCSRWTPPTWRACCSGG